MGGVKPVDLGAAARVAGALARERKFKNLANAVIALNRFGALSLVRSGDSCVSDAVVPWHCSEPISVFVIFQREFSGFLGLPGTRLPLLCAHCNNFCCWFVATVCWSISGCGDRLD